jgi:energy coupling factor transporter S component ThiW
MTTLKKLTTAGVLVAVGVAMSPLSIPMGVARCYPVQHMLNVMAGVLLGPVYAVIMAFVTSCIRNMMGTGTPLAFPGSMLGALLAGLAAKYVYEKYKLPAACAGELVGTGLLGALVAYPVAAFVLGREAAIFTFVVPFAVSSLGGAAIAFALLLVLKRTNIFKKEQA